MRRLAATLLAALALAGCGGGDQDDTAATPTATATPTPVAAAAPSGPQTRSIDAALQDYAEAVRAGDGAAICTRFLSRAVRETARAAGGDCERDLVASAIEAAGPDYEVALTSVDVRGDRATARTRVTERDGTKARVQPLVREDGRWRLTTEAAERAAP